MADRRITVKVTTKAKREKVEEVAPDIFKVSVNEVPENGKANARVLELIASHFGVSKAKVFLVSGATYREKVIVVGE